MNLKISCCVQRGSLFFIKTEVMKMSKSKKIISILLSLCLLFSASLLLPDQTFANTSNSYINIMHKINTARSNYPIRYNFSLEKESDIYFELAINERTTVVSETSLVQAFWDYFQHFIDSDAVCSHEETIEILRSYL